MKNSKKSGKVQRKPAAPAKRVNLQKILATTDFSGQSLPAVRDALGLGGSIGASVTLLHVVDPASSLSGMKAVVLARPDSEVTVLALRQLKAIAQRNSKWHEKITAVVRTGKPFHEITTAAREVAADFIVISTHGHAGVERILLGSTAERPVRRVPCPVRVVRELAH